MTHTVFSTPVLWYIWCPVARRIVPSLEFHIELLVGPLPVAVQGGPTGLNTGN